MSAACLVTTWAADIQTRAEGCAVTRTRMLEMACETLQFCGSGKVVLKIILYKTKKSKLTFIQMKRNLYHTYRRLHVRDFICVFVISFSRLFCGLLNFLLLF